MSRLLIILLIFSLTSISTSIAQTPTDYDFNRKIKKEDLRADFELLWKALNEAHPALYKYTSKEDLTAIYNSKLNSIRDDMTQKDFYLLVSSFIPNIRCANTYTHYLESFGSYLWNNCKMFPFNVKYIDKKGYIIKNLSRDSTISVGSQIISINDIPFQKIVDSLFQIYQSDGFIETSKIWLIFWENNFKYMFSEFINPQQMYSLKLIDSRTGKESRIVVEGITHQENINAINNNRLYKYYLAQNSLKLKICSDSNLAILKIESFNPYILKKTNENYTKFIKNSFAEIERSKVDNLIIDLRNNLGGLTDNALLLYSYLTESKFDVIDFAMVVGKNPLSFKQFINNKTPNSLNSKNALISKNGTPYKDSLGRSYNRFDYLKFLYNDLNPAKKNRFIKNLYVLINGGSNSACIYFNYAVLMNKRGLFIGEEQGGNIDGNTEWDSVILTLPRSNVRVGIPLINMQFVKQNDIKSGRGMMPDYYITPTLQDILDKKDTELNFTINLIQQKK